MNLWLSVIDQGIGISLPIGTSLDGVPICELVANHDLRACSWQGLLLIKITFVESASCCADFVKPDFATTMVCVPFQCVLPATIS